MAAEKDILIVEDSVTQAMLLKHFLEPLAVPVAIARNGAEALARIRKRPPALIISDFIMPGMSGRDLCLQVRNDPALKAIPFILMTAQSDPIAGLELPGQGGPDAFLAKPVTREQLDQTLAALLPQPACPPASGRVMAGAAVLSEDASLIYDGQRLKKNLAGNTRLYKKIIATFLDEFPKQRGNMEQALNGPDRRAVELMAHTIKGAATTLGGEGLRLTALALEKASLGAEAARLRELWASLLREFERLQAVLLSELAGSADRDQ